MSTAPLAISIRQPLAVCSAIPTGHMPSVHLDVDVQSRCAAVELQILQQLAAAAFDHVQAAPSRAAQLQQPLVRLEGQLVERLHALHQPLDLWDKNTI